MAPSPEPFQLPIPGTALAGLKARLAMTRFPDQAPEGPRGLRHSGKRRGTRHVEAGRTAMRRALYMAAVVAMKVNPVLKEFATRLRSRGYPFKYVATAVMRKLVVILDAVLRDGRPCKSAQIA